MASGEPAGTPLHSGPLVTSACGFLEIQGAVMGLVAADVACKAAAIDLLQAQVVCPNKFTLLFVGETAAVETAYGAAVQRIGAGFYDGCVIGRPHQDLARELHGLAGGQNVTQVETVFPGLDRAAIPSPRSVATEDVDRPPTLLPPQQRGGVGRSGKGESDGGGLPCPEALGVLEALSIACGLRTADLALKTAAVRLRELRLGYALGGRSYWAISGSMGAVQAAMAVATAAAAERGFLGSDAIIARPHRQRPGQW